jgi:hypothetical protein
LSSGMSSPPRLAPERPCRLRTEIDPYLQLADLASVRQRDDFSGSGLCWCASHARRPTKQVSSRQWTHRSLMAAVLPASGHRLASRWASRLHNRHPQQLGDRRDSRGPAVGSSMECRWHSAGVASARDACRFPAMACQSCSATIRATPRALPKLPFRRRTLPSVGPAARHDVAISPDSTDSQGRRCRPTVPSEILSAGC